MNTTVFDTETTGLGRNSRLVSICWISYADGIQIVKENNIIKPDGYCISKVASDIHGITTSMAHRQGVPIRGVMERFIAAVSNSNILVAHNIGFDLRIIEEEIKLLNLPNPLSDIKKYCTMKEGKNIAKIEVIGKNGKVSIKSPKLRELHMFLFGEEFINQHNAEADTEACARCYFRMAELINVIETTKIPETKAEDIVEQKDEVEVKAEVEDDSHIHITHDVRLNESQRAFVEMELQNCKLIGVPGGGKTKCIIEKCRYLLRTGVIQSGGEFMIVMFSKSACTDFIDKSNDDIFTYRNVKTIHSLAWNILHHGFGVESPNFRGLVITALIKLKTGNNENLAILSNCRFIIVDEAQDMSDDQHELVSLICTMLNIHLILVGDPNQNIFQNLSNPAVDKHLIEHKGETIILTENYRSTKQIIDFVNCFRPWQNQYPPVICATGTEGKLPYIHRAANDAKEIINHIINDIKTTTIPFEDICIIGPVKLSKPENGTYKSIGLSLFTNLLTKNNIPFVKHYADGNDTSAPRTVTKKTGHVNIQTGHGSKGLEFKKVIAVNFHFKTFTRMPSISDYNGFKYLWYVILSRAMSELSIYAYSNNIIWTELKEAPRELYESNGYIKIPNIVAKIKYPRDNSVTDFIKSLSDTDLLYLMDCIPHDIITTDIFTQDSKKDNEYAALYGSYIETTFEVNYIIHNNKLSEYITKQCDLIKGVIITDAEWIKTYKILCKKYPELLYVFNTDTLHDIKNNVLGKERELIEHLLCNNIRRNDISIRFNDDVRFYDKKHHMELYKALVDNENLKRNIFNLVLFHYQYGYEAKYLLEENWTEQIDSLDCFVENIVSYVPSCNDGYIFQTPVKNNLLHGVIDIINGDTIIEIKFAEDSMTHVLQCVLYYLCKHGTINNEMKLEILNFYTGTLSAIQFNNINSVEFVKKIKSFWPEPE